ncbi:sigma-70 family RNA polymerase sigma factor [Streptomyces sp. NPDC059070]|uniref:sigma-70 family RNA polymerase sigma factor n=1 Tax=Streptomyces sp. NPDC059070 TaxID=3346713 RepID=UPI00369C3A9B
MSESSSPEPSERAMTELINAMPLPFRAFHTDYHRPYYEYARIQLGNERDASELVHGTFLYLAINWQHYTEQPDFHSYAWALHKERVATELMMQGRPAAGPQTMVFERAIKAATHVVIENFRAQFHAQLDELEHTIGLYAAMARLPERQFDVMVLNYALGFTTKRTAQTMGITPETVRTLRCSAKRRLAAELGFDMKDDDDQ